MRKWTSITLISFSPVYSFRVSYFSFRKIQVKNIIKNANCVYPLALVWNWANSVGYIFPKWRKHLPSLFDIVSHVDTMQHLHSAGAAPHSFFPTPIVCNWYSGNRKPLELVWGQRRMTMRLWISWSRCHCAATTTTTQSRHCSQCLSQTGLMSSRVTFLRRVPYMWTVWPEAKGSPELSMCPPSRTSSEKKVPVDLPWATNAIYLSGCNTHTLEHEANKQLSINT